MSAPQHPSDQYIAFADTETGECGERRLNYSDGEAAKFYRELAARGVRVGMEATGYSRWFERLLAELGIESVPPSNGTICRSSASQKAPPVSLES
jgi:hypothetical protein